MSISDKNNTANFDCWYHCQPCMSRLMGSRMQTEAISCWNANSKHIYVILLVIKTLKLFSNTFCAYEAIFLAQHGTIWKFFKINIFNILTGQKRDMIELKLVFMVNTTGHHSKINLSLVIGESLIAFLHATWFGAHACSVWFSRVIFPMCHMLQACCMKPKRDGRSRFVEMIMYTSNLILLGLLFLRFSWQMQLCLSHFSFLYFYPS